MSRLLLVEDNKANRRMVKRKLNGEGFDVVEAGNGEAALERARSEKPDLVLMDLSLPRMDGWEATRKLKSEEGTADIPVVALTAHAMDGDRDSALQAGCDEYLSKPIDFDRLFTVVDNILNGDQ